ncbi:MAG: thiol:disulfide oxidoreductase [Rhodospirillaceae bacterium]|nr:MAG: thiol:disulfide oxidoreductase [Rhodospirillaceae bacterium]
MIDLYWWMSANGHKITMFLEEAGLPYRIHGIDVSKGDQYTPEFQKISPNNKIPAIIDDAPNGGGRPITIFESGAILIYLAEKTGRFMSTDLHTRMETIQWVFWQAAGLGPMGGQAVHFLNFAPEHIAYAIARYTSENRRLLGVLERRLEERQFMVGDSYSIADMASAPWIFGFQRRNQKELFDFEPYPNIKRWFDAIMARPATQRAYAHVANFVANAPKDNRDFSEDARRILFGNHAVKS